MKKLLFSLSLLVLATISFSQTIFAGTNDSYIENVIQIDEKDCYAEDLNQIDNLFETTDNYNEKAGQYDLDDDTDYYVEGGSLVVDFNEQSDENYFDFYTQFDKLPFLMDGQLYGWSLAEQKVILKNYVYKDVEVTVDLSTINECGKIDSGIYIQASSPGHALDNITAWCVNVEHNANSKTFNFKLHRFENNAWMGAKVEVMDLPYISDIIHLRVVVKNGMLYAFLNDVNTPYITYYVGDLSGSVGLRSFYAPNIYDNFKVTGFVHDLDLMYLESLMCIAEEKLVSAGEYCCISELEYALQVSKNASTRKEVEVAEKLLSDAIDKAIEKRSFEELESLLEYCSCISNPNGSVYTSNSFASYIAVRNICMQLDDTDSEYNISYWYHRLQSKIDKLITYTSRW